MTGWQRGGAVWRAGPPQPLHVATTALRTTSVDPGRCRPAATQGTLRGRLAGEKPNEQPSSIARRWPPPGWAAILHGWSPVRVL